MELVKGHTDQCNRIESLEKTCMNMVTCYPAKKQVKYKGTKRVFTTNDTETRGQPNAKNVDIVLTPSWKLTQNGSWTKM